MITMLTGFVAAIAFATCLTFYEVERRLRALDKRLRALEPPDPARMAVNRRRIMERIAEE